VRQKVTIASDITAIVLPIPNSSLHSYLGPTPSSPLAAVPSPQSVAVDPPVPVMHPPGSSAHRLSRRVRHRRQPIAQDGHDCGRMIRHIHLLPSPANSLSVVHALFSSRRATFFSSRVRIEGSCVASLDGTSVPPTPMLACSEPANLPTAISLTSFTNTVTFGMTPGDFAAGMIAVAASVGADLLLHRAARAKAKRPPTLDQLFDMLWPDAREELATAIRRSALGDPQKWIVKSCAAAAAGAARLALTDGPFRMSLVTSGSKGVVDVEVQRGSGGMSRGVDPNLPSPFRGAPAADVPDAWGARL